MSLFTTTATVVRRGERTGRDSHGNPIYGPDSRSTHPAWFEPATRAEDLQSGEQYVDGYTVYLPLGVDLSGADAVELPGLEGEFHLSGNPGLQPGGFVVEGYQQMLVERVRG